MPGRCTRQTSSTLSTCTRSIRELDQTGAVRSFHVVVALSKPVRISAELVFAWLDIVKRDGYAVHVNGTALSDDFAVPVDKPVKVDASTRVARQPGVNPCPPQMERLYPGATDELTPVEQDLGGSTWIDGTPVGFANATADSNVVGVGIAHWRYLASIPS